jgi:hypothetical protein
MVWFFFSGTQYPGMPSEGMPNGPVGTGYPIGGPTPDYSSPLSQMTESINNISNGNSMNSVSSMNNVPQSDSSSQMTHNSGQYVPVSGDQGIPTLRQSDQNNMNSRMTPSSQSSQSMNNGSNQLDHQSPPSSQNHTSGADNCNSIEDINLDPSAIMNDSQSTNLDVSGSINSVIFNVIFSNCFLFNIPYLLRLKLDSTALQLSYCFVCSRILQIAYAVLLKTE